MRSLETSWKDGNGMVNILGRPRINLYASHRDCSGVGVVACGC